jgi:HAD superfamily hydrolase (TIGR01484 family)
MRPLDEMPAETAARVRLVLTDIDDTLTCEGRLPADAYRALEDLTAAGFMVAPITGRPAGWCDMIARFWPVAGVVGENGALYFAYDEASRTMRRVYAAADSERAANRARLEAVKARVLQEVPGAAVSADQAYREADLAIDFCEDVPALDAAAVERIKAIFEDAGAVAKISSIHVNGWFGRYDKLTMTRRFAREVVGLDIDRDNEAVVFVGDSPNDAPMFAFFRNACGVASVQNFAGRLEAEPAYLTRGGGGQGFVEVAERLIDARRQSGV